MSKRQAANWTRRRFLVSSASLIGVAVAATMLRTTGFGFGRLFAATSAIWVTNVSWGKVGPRLRFQCTTVGDAGPIPNARIWVKIAQPVGNAYKFQFTTSNQGDLTVNSPANWQLNSGQPYDVKIQWVEAGPVDAPTHTWDNQQGFTRATLVLP